MEKGTKLRQSLYKYIEVPRVVWSTVFITVPDETYINAPRRNADGLKRFDGTNDTEQVHQFKGWV